MRRTRFGALLMAAGLLVGACTTGASPTPAATPAPTGAATPAPTEVPPETPIAGGTLIAALPGDISRTDSALIDDSNSSYVMNQVMEGLVGLKPGTTGEVVPVLAESWAISDDALTYTFKLRTGIKFHDGTDFNADAVKVNYDRWLNLPDAYSKLEYTYYIDVALRPVVDSVTVNSPTEVAIKLTAPNSAFLLTQTLVPFFIASPAALELGKASDPDFANNTYAQGGAGALTGTGPFKFKEWVPGDHVTIEKNADYWDAMHAAYLDGIVFRVFPDSTSTLNALQAGEIDFTQTLAPIDGKTVQGDATLQAFDRGGSCNLFHLAMNQTHKPFDNVKIREAVGYAINKQSIIDTFYAGQAVVADNWMPPGTFSYKALNLPTYDPEKAKALIAESGVTNLAFDFWYPSDVARPYMPDPKGEFEAMLRDLEAVGFKPNPKTATWRPDYLGAEAGGEYPMWLIGWTCDWAGPDNFLSAAFFGYRARSDNTFGPNEEYAYKNDAMWQAMDNALKTNDLAKAEEYWKEAQDLIRADIPTIPILSSKPPAAAQLYVKGFVPNASLTELFNTVWIAEH